MSESIPREWLEEFEATAKRPLEVRLRYAFIKTYPVGMSLEIVPETDPTRLRKGDEFVVRVWENGAPVSDFPLGFVREGQRHGQIRKTDGEGRIRFRLALGGRWLLRGTKLRKATQPEVDWESDFTTLTVKVK